jgi:hypothetical protein
MANTDAHKSITLRVNNAEGQGYSVLLQVEEQTASGTLVFTPEAGATQQRTLTQMQKSHDGKTLTFRTGPATVTLTVEEGYTPPRLHLVGRVVFPVVDTIYTLSQAEQERFVAWLNTLGLPALA